MKKFIGTKLVAARPMTRGHYNSYRGWTLPSNESGADEGYLVEYLDGGESNHPDHEGYISWSPKAQFEAAYRPKTGLTFGMALEALKIGLRVARAGWNGKGMWLSLSGSLEGETVSHDKFWSKHNALFAYDQPNSEALVLPTITMKTINAHGREAILMGWLASQTDMLSEDWAIL